jgi:ABC-type uncharacterized transport system substrate-binding protein
MTAVGWLSPFKQGDDALAQQALTSGLSQTGWDGITIAPKYADYQYGQNDSTLEDLAKDLIKDGNIDILVATGGVISLRAAVSAAKSGVPNADRIPILYAAGMDHASSGGSTVAGGVNLNTVSQDADRIDELVKLFSNVDRSKICLVYNSNSGIGNSEQGKWPNKPPKTFCLDASDGSNNDTIDFASVFGGIKSPTYSGIVVSADPYFASQRTTLVTQANKCGLPVCYPFSTYLDAGANTSSMSLGADLAAAYTQLGIMVGFALTQTGNGVKIPKLGTYFPPVEIEQQTASGKKWPSKPASKKSKK